MKFFKEFFPPKKQEKAINSKRLIDILANPEIHNQDQVATAELTIAYNGTKEWLLKVKDTMDQTQWEALNNEFLSLDEALWKTGKASEAEIQSLLRICEHLLSVSSSEN